MSIDLNKMPPRAAKQFYKATYESAKRDIEKPEFDRIFEAWMQSDRGKYLCKLADEMEIEKHREELSP